MANTYFYMEVKGSPAARIEFKLCDDIVPKTARSFYELSTGQHGYGYEASKFHRIVPGFMLQGGEFTRGDGTSGESIYGPTFDDENFVLKHDRPFLLSMANHGPNTNGSIFHITHVVFGEVVSDTQVVLDLDKLDTITGQAEGLVVIRRCGTLQGSFNGGDFPAGPYLSPAPCR
ncbi:cyclophilin-like domain-containing protein [Aspergillus keveii]|uniref:Peptidyl-prolyl cis-trans isomerase n=1 Tax=Aspergillus keveii TaxID=714993 RepID=A0ABR4FTS6_9EURO